MKRTGVILAVIFTLGIIVGGLGHQRLSAQQEPVARTVLLKTDVAGAEGKEAVVVFAEIAPGPTTGKHLHAGQEIAHILEGFNSCGTFVNGMRSSRPSGSCGRSWTHAAPPERAVPPTARLTTVPATERYGLAWVSLDTPVADIPAMAYDGDTRFRRLDAPVEVWRVSATRMADNFMDIAHVPWVHTGTFGQAQPRGVPTLTLEHLDDTFVHTLIPQRPRGTASGWHDRRAPGAPEARRRQRS